MEKIKGLSNNQWILSRVNSMVYKLLECDLEWIYIKYLRSGKKKEEKSTAGSRRTTKIIYLDNNFC